MTVKNITISVPDDVYRRARIAAAERESSVSALVREFLTQLSGAESDFDRRRRLQDDLLATIGRFRAGTRVSRDKAHARALR